MRHRHIDTTEWTIEAIDSTLERGGLPDWQDLFSAAKMDRQVAVRILTLVKSRRSDGTRILADWLARKANPEASALVE